MSSVDNDTNYLKVGPPPSGIKLGLNRVFSHNMDGSSPWREQESPNTLSVPPYKRRSVNTYGTSPKRKEGHKPETKMNAFELINIMMGRQVD